MEEQLFRGGVGGFRMIQAHSTFMMHLISIIITSALPRDHQALAPRGWGLLSSAVQTAVVSTMNRAALSNRNFSQFGVWEINIKVPVYWVSW